MTALTTPANAIIVLENIRRTLERSTDLEEIRKLRDQTEIIRKCITAAALGLALQNQAAEVKLRCERQLGQVLAGLSLHGGDRKSENHDRRITLEALGISASESSRWQREWSVPEEDFATYVAQTNEQRRELTSKGLLRLARIIDDAAKPACDGKDPFSPLISGLQKLARQQKPFSCIYANPPWFQEKKTTIAWLRKQLIGLPVKLVSARQAHLHLWVPPEALEAGLALLRAWGFRYKAVLVCRRPPLGYGDYWRQGHDMLLLGVRGRLTFRDSSLPSWLEEDGTFRTDSAREIHARIARVSPPPYLDLFGTVSSPGWAVPAA